VQRGDRIAQMIIAPVTQVVLTEAVTVRATKRGGGGYGSTGTAGPTAKTPAKKAVKATSKRKKAQSVAFPRRSVKSPTGRRR
jgi:dUTP pyrophosphatase